MALARQAACLVRWVTMINHPPHHMSSPDTAPALVTLKQRAGSAALWIGLGFSLTQAIRLGSSIVLTRLLSPDMYGLVAMGTVIISAVVMMSDFGFSLGVIRDRRGDDPTYLNTIWTMQLVRGVALSVLMNLAALAMLAAGEWMPGLLGGSYGDPRLPAVVAIMSLVPITAGLESTNLPRAQRALAMGQVVRNEVMTQITVTTLLIAVALHWPSYWVLPLGWLLYSAGTTALSHWNLPGPANRLGWNRQVAMEAWHFSKWILISSLLTFLFREGDRILLGGLVSTADLGIYAIGALLVNTSREVIYKLAAFVGMPALAEVMRENPERLKEAFRKCRWPIDAICVAAAGFFFAGADRIIEIIYDGRYSAAGHTMSLLALGLIAHRYTVVDQYLIATGETRQLFKRGVIQNITMYIATPLAFSLWGMTGALAGIVLAQTSVVPFMLKVQHDRGLLDWRLEFGTLAWFVPGWGLGWLLNGLRF
jgi:O-antigen/teichoic acid export membrane protein